MFCPLCRKIFCVKILVHIHKGNESLYSRLYVCKECSNNFIGMNATWYILTCPNAKESWLKVARFVIDNIPKNNLIRLARLWGCTRWDYEESRDFLYNNMHACYNLSIECDAVYNKYLL